MTAQHRATPKQWADVQEHADQTWPADACILELRDRLAAAEQRISELEAHSQPTPNDRQIRSSAPAESLVERVRTAIVEHGDGQTYVDEARAAIYEVAAWLDTRGQHGCSLWLREEATL